MFVETCYSLCIMAPRNPNKSRRDKPNDSLANQVGGWLGGAARGVQSWSESQARTFTNPYINAAGRAVGKNPNLPVSGAKEAITNTAWGVVDVASGPIGRAAGKGVTAVGRVVQSGRVVNPVAAARNITSGQRVVVHGSPQSGLSVLKPSTGSKTLPNQNVLFSWNPRRANMSNEIHMKAVRYANKADDAGSIYVAKVPKKVTIPHPKRSVRDSKNMLVTGGEGKVVAEIPLSKPYSQIGQAERRDIYRNVQAELRKAGVQPRGVPQVVDKTLDKVDDALLRAQYKTKKVKQKFMTQAQKDAAAAARRKRIR